MSMISAQIDELRKAALIQGAHARYDVANLLTDAADTILSLRDRSQDLQAENAKLRELVRVLCYCMHESTDCDGCKLNGGAGRMELDAFWACDGLHERLRELEIEVR